TLIFPAAADAARPSKRRPPQRLAGQRIEVPIEGIEVHDGDTFSIDWGNGDRERIRLLGIDCPEIEGESPEILYDQPYAREATWFALGALATTQRAEILRASILDRYGRTLAYVFLDGTNYSVLALQAHLAYETIGEFGDQGLPSPRPLALPPRAPPALPRSRIQPPFERA
ncbi:MAG: thermonuclease family protein, partial [Candidatus Eisenbacteria bacterium]|nr:thermonuclease family protein [Candidatus Eisenbacteria bacterium]